MATYVFGMERAMTIPRTAPMRVIATMMVLALQTPFQTTSGSIAGRQASLS